MLWKDKVSGNKGGPWMTQAGAGLCITLSCMCLTKHMLGGDMCGVRGVVDWEQTVWRDQLALLLTPIVV